MIEIKDCERKLYEMSRIGYIGNYEIYVCTDDAGKIPHFHYRDKDDWKKFHSCIQIMKAEYFAHEGKEDILNSKQRKELQKFMESPPKKTRFNIGLSNNWELVCYLWDMNNSDVDIPNDVEMPDYRNLPSK